MVVLQKFLDGMEKYKSGPSLQNINHAMNIVRITYKGDQDKMRKQFFNSHLS